MPNVLTRGTQIIADIFVLSIAYWIAFFLRFEFNIQLQTYKLVFFTWPYVIILQYSLLALFGVPRFAWRYVGLREVIAISIPLGIAAAILLTLRLTMVYFGGHAQFVVIPGGVTVINFILAWLGISGVRALRRILNESDERKKYTDELNNIPKRTLLIGAGRAGVTVAREVLQNPQLGIDLVGFIDDSRSKIGSIIQGYRVWGDINSIQQIAKKTRAEQVIITISSVNGAAIRTIVKHCEKVNLAVKIIPEIREIIGGHVTLSKIREVTIEDLLGRQEVELDTLSIDSFLKGKRVLVTGAGGSIGSELCKQICLFHPSSLILLEQAENALYEIHRSLLAMAEDCSLVPCVADIVDNDRVQQIFRLHQPQVIFHAAAHKHVPMMEWNPGEAIKNNVRGTQNVANAAHEFCAEAFVMISTDKAVNPTSIMGATKRCAELYIQGISQISQTKFCAVRFGNVLGSAGSVIPLFREQIAKGGPVTVTHPDMRRYFMTIAEACQLVMQAATMGHNGDIFILDMGEPVYIKDLARDLIRLSGFSEDEIEIQYTGLRPGEKIFEELAVTGENLSKTRHAKIFIGKFNSFPLDEVKDKLDVLFRQADSVDNVQTRGLLKNIVKEMINEN